MSTEYKDVSQRRRRASEDSLLAVLEALGRPIRNADDLQDAARERDQDLWHRVLEPVSVAWDGREGGMTARLPAKVADAGEVSLSVELEDGGEVVSDRAETGPGEDIEGVEYVTVRLSLPHVPLGYHRLHLKTTGEEHEALLVAAPQRCFQGGEGKRWGVFLPLYALRSARDWGAGDLTDLEALLSWTRSLGGEVVATLPMLAAFLDEPYEPSPYSPVSRLFWNELYVDVERAPEMERCPEARELIASPEYRRQIERARSEEHVDYRLVYSLKRRTLELLASRWEAKPADDELLEEYARFRAKGDPSQTRYHLYVQWLMEEQLSETAGEAGLFLDHPLGVHPEGFDAWRFRDSFAEGVSAGAPPDTFFTTGQDWGFSPLHPERIREDEYRYPIACLRHLMRHASALRLDHVMWMRRMFWVPEGMSPGDGVYVRYPEEELYAALALESHRNRTVVVGEDLGTVPKSVRRTMARHGVHRVYVLQYELRPSPHTPVGETPKLSQASLNTHDMPPFAAVWDGLDIDDRVDLGLLDDEQAATERGDREELRKGLAGFLRDGGWLTGATEGHEVMRAAQRFLGSGPARTVLVNLEDLWVERRPQNVPGTGDERPNWVRKAATSFEEFREAPEVVGTLQEMDSRRRGES